MVLKGFKCFLLFHQSLFASSLEEVCLEYQSIYPFLSISEVSVCQCCNRLPQCSGCLAVASAQMIDLIRTTWCCYEKLDFSLTAWSNETEKERLDRGAQNFSAKMPRLALFGFLFHSYVAKCKLSISRYLA